MNRISPFKHISKSIGMFLILKYELVSLDYIFASSWHIVFFRMQATFREERVFEVVSLKEELNRFPLTFRELPNYSQ